MSEFFPADHPIPAPEKQLAEWAELLEKSAEKMKGSFKALTLIRAKWLRDMLASQQGLRERCWTLEQALANQKSQSVVETPSL